MRSTRSRRVFMKVIQTLSVDTSATHGRATFLARSGYLLSNHFGSGTSQKSISRLISYRGCNTGCRRQRLRHCPTEPVCVTANTEGARPPGINPGRGSA
eukprot:355736-Chlamydomonas_euryale.AAC.6